MEITNATADGKLILPRKCATALDYLNPKSVGPEDSGRMSQVWSKEDGNDQRYRSQLREGSHGEGTR